VLERVESKLLWPGPAQRAFRLMKDCSPRGGTRLTRGECSSRDLDSLDLRMSPINLPDLSRTHRWNFFPSEMFSDSIF